MRTLAVFRAVALILAIAGFGTTVHLPVDASCGIDVNPVCACDHVNYLNACGARMAATRVEHTGNCLPPDAGD